MKIVVATSAEVIAQRPVATVVPSSPRIAAWARAALRNNSLSHPLVGKDVRQCLQHAAAQRPPPQTRVCTIEESSSRRGLLSKAQWSNGRSSGSARMNANVFSRQWRTVVNHRAVATVCPAAQRYRPPCVHCSSRFTRAQTSSVIPRVNIGIAVQEVVSTEHNANVSAAAARDKVAAATSLSSKLSVSEIQSLSFRVMNASSSSGVRSIGR